VKPDVTQKQRREKGKDTLAKREYTPLGLGWRPAGRRSCPGRRLLLWQAVGPSKIRTSKATSEATA